MRDQIASLNSAVAALVVQLGSKGNKTDSGNPAPSQQATPKIPGMSMKLPIDVPLFSGTGEQEFRTWIKLFERSTRACKVTSTADLLTSLDVFLTGPVARVFQNVQKLGVDSYEDMKTQLAEQFKSSALVRNVSMKFVNRTQKVGERIVEFATDLWDLADEAYMEIPSERIDFLLRDRFISDVLPEFIRSCEFEHCGSFKCAFDCARKVEERMLAAQVAQKLQGQSSVRVNPFAEMARDIQPPNLSLGVTSDFDLYKQELCTTKRELMDSVRATVEESWNSRNMGQSEGRRGGYNKPKRNYRWAEDGTPICSYCSKVGHKYRNCHKREQDEAGQKKKGGQGNPTKPSSGTQIVQDIRTEQNTAKKEAGNIQGLITTPPKGDPHFSSGQTGPECVPTPQQLSAQINSLCEEMRDLRLASLHNQVNSVSVSVMEMDDSVISLLSPEEMNFNDLEPEFLSSPEPNAVTEESDERRMSTLGPGEEKILESPESPTHPKPKFFGVRPNKPTIWASLLTIVLFMSFWSQGLAKQTSVVLCDLSLNDLPLSLGVRGSIFDPTQLWACFLFLSEGPYLVRCAKAGLCEAWSSL
ncbi:MAG: hypothetical protein GY696_37245, partial [Gammaproteobacteria bacterium]|nr:hypothetical protein [Gammaproteobacteria bacterium]